MLSSEIVQPWKLRCVNRADDGMDVRASQVMDIWLRSNIRKFGSLGRRDSRTPGMYELAVSFVFEKARLARLLISPTGRSVRAPRNISTWSAEPLIPMARFSRAGIAKNSRRSIWISLMWLSGSRS